MILYNLETKEKKLDLNIDKHLKYIYSLCFINNNQLALGNSTGVIGIFNYESNKFVHKLEDNCLTVRALAYDRNNEKLFTASDDLHINVIDICKGFKVISPMVSHKDKISCLVYHEKKNLLISSSYDGEIKLWDYREKLPNVGTYKEESKANTIWDMSLTSEGDYLVYTTEEGPGAYQIK